MGITLAGGFAWTAVRIDALEISLSNERIRAAEIEQMVDRLDVILTAADLTLNGGETYTAQWAASRARELAGTISEFKATNASYWPAFEQRGVIDKLERLAQMIVLEPSSDQDLNKTLSEYDEIARILVTTANDALEYTVMRVESAEQVRGDNARFLILIMGSASFLFLFFSLLASNYLTRRIVRPLELLGIAAKEDQELNVSNPDITTAPNEIAQVADSFARFANNLSLRVKERTAQLEATTEKLISENFRRRRVEADLQVALEESRNASAAKTAFLSVMSHELRTPMNAVMGALHIIKAEPLTENQKRLVDTANDAGDFLVNLLTDVLDISKIDSDGVEIDRTPTEIRPFLEQLGRQVSVQVESADCAWSISVGDDLAGWLMIDRNRLKQVLINFIGNACKFAPGTPLLLSASPVEGDIANLVRFSLSDGGPGISPEHKKTIFEPFNQVESNLDRNAGGVGLGLSISRRLAEAMEGTCGVESQINKGSIFHIELPCAPVEAPTELRGGGRSLAAKGSGSPKKKDHPLHVLLVEDSHVNQLIAKTMLEQRGLRVTAVESGLAAIEIASQETFDAILMDLQMPGMDGITAALKIQDLESLSAECPIIPMTANVGPEFETQTVSAGMIGFIPKPLKPDDMMDSIYSAIRQKREA